MATTKSYLAGKGVRTIVTGDIKVIQRISDQRKQMVVTNITAGANLYVTGPDEVPALVALPNLPLSIEMDGEFRIRNDSGVTITYVVGELFNVAINQAGIPRVGGGGGAGGGSDATNLGQTTGRGTGNSQLP